MKYARIIFILVVILPVRSQGQTQILNLSENLVSLGISAQNLAPNQPTLDAGPLVIQGVNYAVAARIPIVAVDPGAYYFLSLQSSTAHVAFTNISNLTIDFAGSDLYLAHPNYQGIVFNVCTSLTLQNFTIDYSPLPFTQVSVTSVNAAGRTIGFSTISGWQPPSALNTSLNGSLPDTLYFFIFRNGQPALGVNQLQAQRPFGANSFIVVNNGLPWEATSVL